MTEENSKVEEVEKPKEKAQRFPFAPVLDERLRIYVFDNNRKVQIDNVIGISIGQDGSHRLLTKNQKIAHKVPAGWINIMYIADDDGPYVFSE